jgi:hypothetical protein
MKHVFLLFVFLGVGEVKTQVSKDMYFRDLNDCVWYAQKLHKQGESVTAYCLPATVNKDMETY